MNVNQNNLSPLNFKFKLGKTPNVEFRVQGLSIPGMNLGMAPIPSPFVSLQDTGSLEYGPLRINFMVGENMADYLEIFQWMLDNGMPDGLGQYKRSFSDGTALILNSNYKPIVEVRFTNLFPISISELDFNSVSTELQFITASATFNFDRFYFKKVE